MNDEIHEELNLEPVVEKPSLADRIQRDKAARLRRRETKEIVHLHSYKEEKDARERLKAKRRLEKQKKRANRKLLQKVS